MSEGWSGELSKSGGEGNLRVFGHADRIAAKRHLHRTMGSHRAPCTLLTKKDCLWQPCVVSGGEGGIDSLVNTRLPLRGRFTPLAFAVLTSAMRFAHREPPARHWSNNGFSPGTLPLVTKKAPHLGVPFLLLAERVGFEPTVRLRAHLISSQAHSTTLAPLRRGGIIRPRLCR